MELCKGDSTSGVPHNFNLGGKSRVSICPRLFQIVFKSLSHFLHKHSHRFKIIFFTFCLENQVNINIKYKKFSINKKYSTNLSTYNMPGTVLSPGAKTISKPDTILGNTELTV